MPASLVLLSPWLAFDNTSRCAAMRDDPEENSPHATQ
jgi:hypothetical protein